MNAISDVDIRPQIFLSTPISSFDSDEERKVYKILAEKFISSVKELFPAANVCTEILEHSTTEEFDNPESALVADFNAISSCTHFVLVYPRPLATSALMELGYAMAMDIPCLIYANSIDELPYLAKPADSYRIKVVPITEYGKPTTNLQLFLALC
jgi:hypothetical protein